MTSRWSGASTPLTSRNRRSWRGVKLGRRDFHLTNQQNALGLWTVDPAAYSAFQSPVACHWRPSLLHLKRSFHPTQRKRTQDNGRNASDVADATTASIPEFWPLRRLCLLPTFLAFVAVIAFLRTFLHALRWMETMLKPAFHPRQRAQRMTLARAS